MASIIFWHYMHSCYYSPPQKTPSLAINVHFYLFILYPIANLHFLSFILNYLACQHWHRHAVMSHTCYFGDIILWRGRPLFRYSSVVGIPNHRPSEYNTIELWHDAYQIHKCWTLAWPLDIGVSETYNSLGWNK